MVRQNADQESSAMDQRPRQRTLETLARAATGCTACDLYKNATQVVFGEGLQVAEVMFVGEIPGDEEDRAGRPFVGPAGRLLRKVINDVGLDESALYLTNIVKHFKWQPRGRRRLHVTPTYQEVQACRPWLLQEVDLVRPRIVVCLGATAAQSFMGRDFRVTRSRGQIFRMGPVQLIATLHPAAILRMPTSKDRELGAAQLAADLTLVRELLLREHAQEASQPHAVAP